LCCKNESSAFPFWHTQGNLYVFIAMGEILDPFDLYSLLSEFPFW